ncbi:MAG: response regulator [Candidatus Cloacimonetes bacterium]|nr:response regulator [Candidatus Cloacimonadota bacterium]
MKKQILVVDDKRFLRETLIDYLGEEYDIIEAETGEIALEKYRDLNIDLVLLDVNLPGINGIKTLQMMKKIKKDIPVIGLTGELTIEIRNQLINAGCFDIQTKSAIYEKLLSTIDSAIKGEQVSATETEEVDYEKIAEELMNNERWEESAIYLKEAGFEKEILRDYQKALELFEESARRFVRAGRKTKSIEIEGLIADLKKRHNL